MAKKRRRAVTLSGLPSGLPSVIGNRANGPISQNPAQIKTRFPCKVMDKNGNVKKIIAPQEMPETSYTWDKQPYPSKRRNKNA